MTNTSMCQSFRDEGEGGGVIEDLSRVEKFLEVIHLKMLFVETRPVHCEPVVQLLNVEEVFSGKPDGVPNLLSVDQVRIIDERAMQCSEPQFDAENSIFVKFHKVTAGFLELTVKHGLKVGGVIHQDLSRDLHQGILQNRMISIVVECAVIILDDFYC